MNENASDGILINLDDELKTLLPTNVTNAIYLQKHKLVIETNDPASGAIFITKKIAVEDIKRHIQDVSVLLTEIHLKWGFVGNLTGLNCVPLTGMNVLALYIFPHIPLQFKNDAQEYILSHGWYELPGG